MSGLVLGGVSKISLPLLMMADTSKKEQMGGIRNQ